MISDPRLALVSFTGSSEVLGFTFGFGLASYCCTAHADNPANATALRYSNSILQLSFALPTHSRAMQRFTRSRLHFETCPPRRPLPGLQIGVRVSEVVHKRFGRTILELGGNNATIGTSHVIIVYSCHLRRSRPREQIVLFFTLYTTWFVFSAQ